VHSRYIEGVGPRRRSRGRSGLSWRTIRSPERPIS